MDDFGIINYFNEEDIDINDNNPINVKTYHSHIDILKNYDLIKQSNKTKPILTKYEKTKILGLRAEMIASGAKPLVKYPEHITYAIDIARLELKQRKIPFIIKRKTNNNFDYWKLEDLFIQEL
jgi:DNA-directed RNA polymerase subunit K/omega